MIWKRSLDLQAKISLVLVAVIFPTFLVVTVAENKLTQPMLEEEMRQIGLTAGKTLAADVTTSRLFMLPNPTPKIERLLQEMQYAYPNIVRMDVFLRDAVTGEPKLVASNIEEDAPPPSSPIVETVTGRIISEHEGDRFWEVQVPIATRGSRSPKKVLGMVSVLVSLRLVDQITGTLWETTIAAALLSCFTLFLALRFFLRKTIANERLLRKAETQNLQLTEKLHETERQLMNNEKLAVMGQLTASFAHEIGTPLNAIGGHLQLLQEEVGQPERLGIINGQVSKIENIVKGFLQSTAKPSSQRQLVDLNRILERTLAIARPRVEALGVEIVRNLDRKLGPLRLVPLDVEQIFLNLVNNSLDSLSLKKTSKKGPLQLQLSSSARTVGGKACAVVVVHDTGEGIPREDLNNVLKPFFTTKPPGEGTGLGLTICQQLAGKYDGLLRVESKQGLWTRVTLQLPYQANA